MDQYLCRSPGCKKTYIYIKCMSRMKNICLYMRRGSSILVFVKQCNNTNLDCISIQCTNTMMAEPIIIIIIIFSSSPPLPLTTIFVRNIVTITSPRIWHRYNTIIGLRVFRYVANDDINNAMNRLCTLEWYRGAINQTKETPKANADMMEKLQRTEAEKTRIGVLCDKWGWYGRWRSIRKEVVEVSASAKMYSSVLGLYSKKFTVKTVGKKQWNLKLLYYFTIYYVLYA